MPNDVINTITIGGTTYDIGGSGGGSGRAINATLLANGWDTNKRQALQFIGYNVNQNGVIGMPTSVTSTQKTAYQDADIRVYSQSSDTFTFECGATVPTIDLPVTLFVTDASSTAAFVYKPSGSKTVAELISSLLVEANLGNVYNMTDSGTTTADFVEGAGKPIYAGDDVGIIDNGTSGSPSYKFNKLGGFIDLSNYIQKSQTAGLVKNDGTIDETEYQPAEEGKGLSTNDYDNTDKSAVATIPDKVDWVSNGILGSKNLIPYPYENTSGERQGVTFIVNADGSVSLSGTASATNDAAFTLLTVNDDRFSGYMMTGGKSNIVYMRQRITDKNGTYKRASADTGSGVALDTIDASTEKYTIAIWVAKDTNVDNITIYPMLRIANDTDDTYRPYAKTNKQLTDEVAENTEDIDTLENRADNTTTSISGNPISISGLKSNQLAINPIITFEPIQAGSGTPSPSNIRAISGYDKVEVESCGKNLCDNSSNKTGGYYNASGSWVVDSSHASSGLIPVVPNTTYRGCMYNKSTKQPINDVVYVLWSDETTGTGQYTSATITTGADTKYITIRNYGADASYIQNNNFLFALELGDTSSTTYPEYDKTTDLSESLGQTVYGATWYPRMGEFTVTKMLVDLGSLTWYRYSTTSIFHATPTGQKVISSVVCDSYNGVNSKIVNLQDKEISASAEGFSTGCKIGIRDDSYTDATAFGNSLTGKYAVTELAEPITIQLTPHEISLLKDYAYVSTNGTSISLDYHNGELASLADVSQLGETVNELGDKVSEIHSDVEWLKNKRVQIDLTKFNFTSSTSLAYTGLSITIPKRRTYGIAVSLIYANGAPEQLVISDSNTLLNTYMLYYNNNVANGSICGRTGDSAITLYIWAKYVNSSANFLNYTYWYEP